MKRIIKAGFMMLLGAAIWMNGGDVKEAKAQECAPGGSVLYQDNGYHICNYPLGGCQQHPPGQIPPNCQPQPQRPTNTRPVPPKPSSYGAVAWSDNAIGLSSNQSTKQDALNIAMQKCGQPDCEIATWYANQCVAMSYGVRANNKPLWKIAAGSSAKVAEKNALLNCQKDGAKNCKVHFSECSLP